jgi:magnesium transporter
MKHRLTSKEVTWINVQSPTAEELAELVREMDLDRNDAEFVAQSHLRPEVTIKPQYVLLMIHVPVFDRKLRVTQGVPLYFIVRERQLYSLHYEPIISLDKIRQRFEKSPEVQEEYFDDDASGLCLYLVASLYDGAFRKLEKLTKHIDIAEDAVFRGNERKMVEEISVLTRDVMDFRKIIRPQTSLFSQTPQHQFLTEENGSKWRRIHGQLMKMWELLEGMFESVRELSNTNFTLLQHKENELLRLLTMYSIVVIPMLIVTDPFFSPRSATATMIDKLVFWVVLGILLIALLSILWHFRKKKLS